MSDVVVDSSVVVKWVLPETDSADAEQFGLGVLTSGGHLVVLDLALIEVANALWKQFHRGRLTLDELVAQQFLLGQRPLEVVATKPLIEPSLEIAARYDVSIYDALLVAPTQDRDVDGVSADKPLVNAVKADHPQVHLLSNWLQMN